MARETLKQERIQIGLRMPENVRAEVLDLSEEMGLSMNDTILMLVHIGMTVKKNGYVIPIPKE